MNDVIGCFSLILRHSVDNLPASLPIIVLTAFISAAFFIMQKHVTQELTTLLLVHTVQLFQDIGEPDIHIVKCHSD
jgi:hypothetical protein